MTCYLLYIFSWIALSFQEERPLPAVEGTALKKEKKKEVHQPIDSHNSPLTHPPSLVKAGVMWQYAKMIYLWQDEKKQYAGGVAFELKDIMRSEFSMGYVWEKNLYKTTSSAPRRQQENTIEGVIGNASMLLRLLHSDDNTIHGGLSYGAASYAGERTFYTTNYAPLYQPFTRATSYEGIEHWIAIQVNFSTKLYKMLWVGSSLHIKKFLPTLLSEGTIPHAVPGIGDKRLALYPSLQLFIAFYPFRWVKKQPPEASTPLN